MQPKEKKSTGQKVIPLIKKGGSHRLNIKQQLLQPTVEPAQAIIHTGAITDHRSCARRMRDTKPRH